MKKKVKINEGSVPVTVRGPDGKIGFRWIDSETKKPTSGFIDFNTLPQGQKDYMDRYFQPDGYQGYKLDPNKFKTQVPAVL